ncbi:MAG: DUF58 domain-containing protein [Chloroflexi bacterium]|nr:DUF58 domain-containing protein [Chloroflexota bacterium]
MKIRKIVVIAPLVLLALALVLSSNLLLRLFFLSALVALLGYAWTYFSARGIRVEFGETPARSQVGAGFNEEVTVRNESRLPKLLLKLEENTDLPGYRNTVMLNLRAQSSISWQTHVECRRRGQYHLGQAFIWSGDPFGLFQQKFSFGQSQYVLVYPATVDLSFFEVTALGSVGNASGGFLAGRTGPNASSVRELAYGDGITKIHWPSTARTGKLMVKVFGEEHSPTVSENIFVVADMHEAAHIGNDDDSTVEYTVTIAASLVKKYLEEGLKVGLALSSDPIGIFRPDRGEDHLDRMLEALALVQPNGQVPVDRFVASCAQQMGSDATAVIVSPAAAPLLGEAARQLRIRRNAVGVVWLDRASFGGAAGPPNIARNLSLLGIHMHIVRKGDDLALALDSRGAPVAARRG